MFEQALQIRFGHCDPAGIVFYPRYFEMLNAVVEDWCAQELGFSFSYLHHQLGLGLPTVKLETEFKKVSILGEIINARLRVQKIGASSLHLSVDYLGADNALRLSVNLVLVCMDLASHKAQAFPAPLRNALENFYRGQ